MTDTRTAFVLTSGDQDSSACLGWALEHHAWGHGGAQCQASEWRAAGFAARRR